MKRAQPHIAKAKYAWHVADITDFVDDLAKPVE